jgi:alkylation response protein AidB-like acyl-CoA dehydrogenase
MHSSRAGLFRLWTPAEFGGVELDPVAGLRVIAAVSELDGSVGWNVMFPPPKVSLLVGCLPGGTEDIWEPPGCGRRAVTA